MVTLSDFKTYDKIPHSWHDQWNEVRSSEMNFYINSQLIFSNQANECARKTVLSANGTSIAEYPHIKQ